MTTHDGNRTTALLPDTGVALGYVDGSSRLPFVISPESSGMDVFEWAKNNEDFIETELDRHGALLFRGFGVNTPEALTRFITATFGTPLPEAESTTPRTRIEGNIYTSTDYPANQEIFLHNENSYMDRFPLRVYFCCVKPSDSGGETPIADCRRIFSRLRPETRSRFADGYLYVRNFGGGAGMSWQTAFHTNNKQEVADYCRAHQIDYEWRGENLLRTRQLRRSIATHPRTGESVWFNHLTFFHLTTLPKAFQEVLQAEFASSLPNQTYHADGSDIAPEILDELRGAYRAEMATFPWQTGDVILLDNMLVAHARKPFKGARKVIVGLANECSWDQV